MNGTRRSPVGRLWVGVAMLGCGLLVAGCGVFSGVLNGGLQGVPLPGGADTGDQPYRVTAEFTDVLELVPQSLVKVNDVSVGAVREIALDPATWHAKVTLELNRSVQLPANAVARLRNTSLLGEKFVELSAPPGEQAQGTLADGALIPVQRTTRATEVEEVLGALSLLLNGGGVEQIRTIATELNSALAGNEPQITALLGDLDKLVSGLDERKAEINRAIDSVNRLSATLVAQRGQIATALDGLAPGLKVLADQRTELTGTLQALDRLSVVATDTINRSHDDVVADLQQLRPTLHQLAEAGTDLPNSLQLIATFPFTDGAVREGLIGDYSNLYVTGDLNLGTALENLSSSRQPLMGLPPALGEPLAPSGPLAGPLLDGLSGAVPPPPPVQRPELSSAPAPPSGVGSLLGPLVGGKP